jgi:hypothetical protein
VFSRFVQASEVSAEAIGCGAELRAARLALLVLLDRSIRDPQRLAEL